MPNLPQDVKRSPCFHLKGTLVSFTILDLCHFDSEQFSTQLADKVKQAPLFFKNAPIILSLEREECHQVDLLHLVELCREYGLSPIGIRGGSTNQQIQAEELSLTVLPADQVINLKTAASDIDSAEKNKELNVLEDKPLNTRVEPETIFLPAKVVTTPIRSGQKVYAPCTDLIVLAPVSPGAEVLADGNIHVYAPLRGRALAGVLGDENARIFTTHMEAELISIAGFYKTSEDMQEFWKKSVNAMLENERLVMQII